MAKSKLPDTPANPNQVGDLAGIFVPTQNHSSHRKSGPEVVYGKIFYAVQRLAGNGSAISPTAPQFEFETAFDYSNQSENFSADKIQQLHLENLFQSAKITKADGNPATLKITFNHDLKADKAAQIQGKLEQFLKRIYPYDKDFKAPSLYTVEAIQNKTSFFGGLFKGKEVRSIKLTAPANSRVEEAFNTIAKFAKAFETKTPIKPEVAEPIPHNVISLQAHTNHAADLLKSRDSQQSQTGIPGGNR